MKKIILASSFLMITTMSQPLLADQSANKAVIENNTGNEDQVIAERLISRLVEIRKTDLSTLTREEKNELRKEVLSTKKQLKEISGGVYLSTGAIIIIILLLIILL